MKERGVVFNDDMVRAILEGRKTQTRRPVKMSGPITAWLSVNRQRNAMVSIPTLWMHLNMVYARSVTLVIAYGSVKRGRY